MSSLASALPERIGLGDTLGVRLERCIEPGTTEELGEVLAEASRERTPLLVLGGGTRLRWANRSPRIEPIRMGLSTLAIRGVDVFEPDEGVLHARAGTRIAEVQQAARLEGWELPLDPPGPSSTVGGVISSAATGPRAHRLGRVADAVLGLEVVGADGVVRKCGGRVVKNVTGYDLAKLYCGAFGVLGVVTGAWLRLRPVPATRSAFAAPLPEGSGGFEASRALSDLTSLRALVWIEGEGADAEEAVYLELGGSEAEVAHDLAAALARLKVQRIEPERIDALRDARAESRDDTIVLRARVPGTQCEAMTRRFRAAGLAVSVDLGLGVLHARGRLASRDTLLELRAAAASVGGIATFESIPDDWREGLDVFGFDPALSTLTRALKQRFDPLGILNAGRFQAEV